MNYERIALRIVVGVGLLSAIVGAIILTAKAGHWLEPSNQNCVNDFMTGIASLMAAIVSLLIVGLIIVGFCAATEAICRAIAARSNRPPTSPLGAREM